MGWPPRVEVSGLIMRHVRYSSSMNDYLSRCLSLKAIAKPLNVARRLMHPTLHKSGLFWSCTLSSKILLCLCLVVPNVTRASASMIQQLGYVVPPSLVDKSHAVLCSYYTALVREL